jgi:mannose/cellobiose epimerase-like protein (N-acyl-D-glucosamine 2-epimerase family)
LIDWEKFVVNFQSRRFLEQHIAKTLQFYEPRAVDPAGGFFHYFLDDGTVYNTTHRHLVSATRFVFNGAMARRHSGRAAVADWARHGLAHLAAFRLPSGLYAWTVDQGHIEDATVMAYGQAFVLLAKAHAFSVGCATREEVADAFDRMNEAFFKPADQAYADEITPEGTLLDYRGQNANMHMCEACLAAHEFTGEARYLDRAEMLIERFAFDLASQSGNLVWEHYRADWSVDWDYNKDNPGNIFKPWGFQTGHQTEWAKLLMIAHQFRPNPRWVARAAHLQRAAYRQGWDAQHGGLIYGFAPDHSPCDTDKYFWVQAESFASAWRLWRHTGEAEFLQQYQAIWQWSWAHMVDHEHGAWFRILGADGRKLENTKSPAGKVDYHTMGACWDVLSVGGLED